MRTRPGWVVAAVVAGVLLGRAAPTHAWNLDVIAQGLRITTFLTERFAYDSNVFLLESRPTGSWIARTQPGFLLDFATGPLSASLGAKVEFVNYFSVLIQDAINPTALLDLAYESPAGLRLELRDDFYITNSPQTSELTGLTQSLTNRARLSGEYRLSDRFSVGASYGNNRVDYQDTDTELNRTELNRTEHLVSLTGFWRFRPKLSLLAISSFGYTSFAETSDRDLTRHLIEAGIRGEITPRISSTFRLGYEDRQPRNDRLNGYRGLVFGGDFTFLVFERTRIVLAADRRPQESTAGNNFFYLETAGTLRIQHEFGAKVKANVRANLGENQYFVREVDADGRAKLRHDTFVGGGASVTYDLQTWVSLGLDYFFSKRGSNFEGSSYSDHRVGGSITLQF